MFCQDHCDLTDDFTVRGCVAIAPPKMSVKLSTVKYSDIFQQLIMMFYEP